MIAFFAPNSEKNWRSGKKHAKRAFCRRYVRPSLCARRPHHKKNAPFPQSCKASLFAPPVGKGLPALPLRKPKTKPGNLQKNSQQIIETKNPLSFIK